MEGNPISKASVRTKMAQVQQSLPDRALYFCADQAARLSSQNTAHLSKRPARQQGGRPSRLRQFQRQSNGTHKCCWQVTTIIKDCCKLPS